jgi:primosomal protein N' (replication factor Y)
VVQTRNPAHHALRWAARHDAESFLAEELKDRTSPPYPPVVALANILVSGDDEAAVSTEAMRLADWCNALISRHNLPVTLLGPAPCALARIKDRWRWHVLLKGTSEELGKVVRYASGRITSAGAVRVILDRDPVSLL